MSTFVIHSSNLFLRQIRGLLRQPIWVAVQLVQPMIWLLLFGSLFSRIVDLPGFGSDSFITYITPGILIMMGLFTAGFSGMSLIEDMDRGVMNRFLVSPASRISILIGNIGYLWVVLLVQAVIVLFVAWLMGAQYPAGAAGLAGFAVTMLSMVVLATLVGSFSAALALLLRRQESVIAMVQFLVMPLMFTSSALMNPALAPSWLGTVSTYNPVNWAVNASRGALSADPAWADIFRYDLGLAALAVIMLWLAGRTFRSYQRSI